MIALRVVLVNSSMPENSRRSRLMDVEGAMAIPIEFSPIRNRGAEWKHNWKTGTFSGNRSSNEKAAGIGYP
jgi:predicted anti-sigma-YlaC factor YlaD